ncbi:low-specificity L-threonine aldolase [Anaerobaca lacustris]|uniref:Low-specificity L-threonine aldolase n=1 Tax=Anaerobaca lacustris TaxID=3044600 RepID=A0AAW6U179_9BACT|nr:low-specificity L-threonine aldolase [Sedimentisphaerales bacterium M17dextr]
MKTIDVRSDTVTLPSPEMRQAISQAELGDDVFGEDPTVLRLERRLADLVGKEAALLVASGTMGNLVCVLTHCGRGDEVILGDQSHTFYYEAGGISALGGIHPHTIPNQGDGTLRLEDIRAAIRPDNVHFPRTGLICLENTQNRCGGAALSAEYSDAVASLARDNGLAVHLDGARIFNAAVALGVDVSMLTRGADSVSICLSKGLAAPVGSVVCGSQPFIDAARRTRKILGGGMRQAGIIAAAGLVALDSMIDRIHDDHANAARLAKGIAELSGLQIDPAGVRTNIVYFDVVREGLSAETLVSRLAQRDVKMLCSGPGRIRAVTHYGIDRNDIDRTLSAMADALDAP